MPYDTLSVLGDPTRQRLLDRMRSGPKSVGELADELPITRPAVSQHLKVLREAGLVEEHREGTRHYFSLNPRGFAELRRYIDNMWSDALTAFANHASQKKRTVKERKK
jgi:DNA-binding transcriptional ArsR family regulator